MPLIIRTVVLVLILASNSYGQTPTPAEKWYKGNTHTHTLNTDGRDVPYEVAK